MKNWNFNKYNCININSINEEWKLPDIGDSRPWRMNLSASYEDVFFLAVDDKIHVYEIPNLSYNNELNTNHIKENHLKPIKIIDMPNDFTQEELANMQGTKSINTIKVGYIDDESILVTADDRGIIRVFFLSEMDKKPISFYNQCSSWGIAINSKDKIIAVSSNLHIITLFNLQTNNITKLYGHEDNIPYLDFHQNGQRLVSCSIDGTCRVWDIILGRCLAKIQLNSGYLWSCEYLYKDYFLSVEKDSLFNSIQEEQEYNSRNFNLSERIHQRRRREQVNNERLRNFNLNQDLNNHFNNNEREINELDNNDPYRLNLRQRNRMLEEMNLNFNQNSVLNPNLINNENETQLNYTNEEDSFGYYEDENEDEIEQDENEIENQYSFFRDLIEYQNNEYYTQPQSQSDIDNEDYEEIRAYYNGRLRSNFSDEGDSISPMNELIITENDINLLNQEINLNKNENEKLTNKLNVFQGKLFSYELYNQYYQLKNEMKQLEIKLNLFYNQFIKYIKDNQSIEELIETIKYIINLFDNIMIKTSISYSKNQMEYLLLKLIRYFNLIKEIIDEKLSNNKLIEIIIIDSKFYKYKLDIEKEEDIIIICSINSIFLLKYNNNELIILNHIKQVIEDDNNNAVINQFQRLNMLIKISEFNCLLSISQKGQGKLIRIVNNNNNNNNNQIQLRMESIIPIKSIQPCPILGIFIKKYKKLDKNSNLFLKIPNLNLLIDVYLIYYDGRMISFSLNQSQLPKISTYLLETTNLF